MKREYVRKAYALLCRKMLVIPTAYVLNGTAYKAPGVHTITADDALFPEKRAVKLCMPLSATKDNKLQLAKKFSEQIVYESENDTKELFNLKVLKEDISVAMLSKEDKKIISKKVDLEDDAKTVELPMKYYAHLLLSEEDKIISKEFEYDDVILATAISCGMEFERRNKTAIETELRHGGMKKEKIEAVIDDELGKRFVSFLKTFDAIEFASVDENIPLIMTNEGGYMEGVDASAYLASYDLMFFKLPTKTALDKDIKKQIVEKVLAKEQEVREFKAAKTKTSDERGLR
ncbi:MAG: hypothetical protein J6K39_00955 [Clostridia bacterium]|nr:hypothetical protein [Clostridia bacterium]